MSIAAGLRTQVINLTAAISFLEPILDAVRTRLQDVQNQLDSIVYPVLTLPPEMTSEIFIHCLPSEPEIVFPDDAPLLLTRVCRAWRQIAISTPALWATFVAEETDSIPRLAEIAKTWLKRAQKHPLSVRIHGNLPEHSFNSFMKTLRRHSREMRSLELQMDGQDFEDINAHVLEDSDFPMLQRLSIDIDHGPGDSAAVVMVDNVPLLHEVVMIAAAPSFVVLPWEQLTKFTGELYEAKHCLEALCVMPNLLECGFSAFKYDVMEDGPSDAGQFGTVSHRNIEHLTLSGSTFYTDRPFGGHILTLIILPALQTLEFSGNYGFDAEELDSFLRHSSPPLRKLAVCPLEGGIEVRLSKPFRNLTRLVELEISRPLGTFVSGFLAVLGCDSSVLPQLQKLAFLGCHIPEDEEDDIEPKLEANVDEILRHAAEPITKRWAILPGCAQLQSFCVTSESSAYFEEDLLPFRELKNSGMDVYIGTGGPSVI